MRLLGAHRAALLVLACVVVVVIHGLGEAEALGGGGGFVRAQGTRFVLDGNPYYANGFNAYWLMLLAADPSQRGKVTAALGEAAGHGLTVARTWAFSDGGGGNALQLKYGIKVILSLVDNYDSFGGRKQYVNWARAQGQGIGSDDEFFTNPVVKGFYKNHVKTVLTRKNTITGVAYRDDPTILAWELMNEPRCQSDLSGRTVQSWITEMAAHVKSIDRNHMLEVGLEGFYGASSPSRIAAVNPSGYQLGTDFIANNQVPGIDFATVVGQGRPGAAGVHGERDALYGTVYAKIYESARRGGATVGGLFWQLLVPGMDSYRDGYEVVFGETPSTTGVITTNSRRLRFLSKAFARARQAQPARGKGRHNGGK
uniref:mannan endo-1,4-beta-mannosidase n=1 Tax=Oryza rufipogon TaxID=4529 RepID=A0A0E0N0B9_ORYRU